MEYSRGLLRWGKMNHPSCFEWIKELLNVRVTLSLSQLSGMRVEVSVRESEAGESVDVAEAQAVWTGFADSAGFTAPSAPPRQQGKERDPISTPNSVAQIWRIAVLLKKQGQVSNTDSGAFSQFVYRFVTPRILYWLFLIRKKWINKNWFTAITT